MNMATLPTSVEVVTCIDCGAPKSKGFAKGRCKKCYGRRAYQNNRLATMVQHRQYFNEGNGKARHYWRSYGLTMEEVEELKSRGCEVCGAVDDLCIDHDHATKQVRGCLCRSCNWTIGHLSTSEKLRKAADYLERNGSDDGD